MSPAGGVGATLVRLAKHVGIALRQTFAKEGRTLRFRAGGYAHAKPFKRLRGVLGRLLREIERKRANLAEDQSKSLLPWLGRGRLLHAQRPKNKLYALHAPEVECISKGKARQPYEFE